MSPRSIVLSRLLLASTLMLLFSSILAFAGDDAGSAVDQDSHKKIYKDIPLGPFRLDLGGSVRLRHEYQSGFDVRMYNPGTEDHFLLTRVMLDFNLKLDSRSRIFIQFRDAHALGTRLERADFRRSNPFNDIWDIRQAYFEWLKIGETPLGFRLGRQQISYGDQRIFGPGLWGNTGRYTWDAAMLKIDTSRAWIDGWIGRPIQNRPEIWPNREFKAPTAFVVYGGVKELPCRLEFFYAGKYDSRGQTEGESGTGNLLSHSVGFQLQKQSDRWVDFTSSFVMQAGRYGKDAIRAFGTNAGIGVTLPVKWRPRLAGQFTWGSGDKNPMDGVHGTFDGVFGGADIDFYGDLNLFFWANLRDYELDLYLHPGSNVTLMLENHYFTLDQASDAWYTTGMAALRRDATGLSGKALGNEFDLRISWRAARDFDVLAGWGYFSPAGYVKNTGPADAASGYFLQAAYAF